jgi:agmatinase
MDRLNLPFSGVPSFLRARISRPDELTNADYAVIGIPSDEGTPWVPGSRFGPRSIREQSMRLAAYGAGVFDLRNQRSYLGNEMAEGRIADCGDVDVVFTNRELTYDRATADIRQIIKRGAMPIMLGGDHGVSYPAVRAFDKPISVVQFDAHLDMKEPNEQFRLSNGTPFYLISELENVNKVVHVGIRSLRTRKSDFDATIAMGNSVVQMHEYDAEGPNAMLRGIPDGPVYISIDIDALDISLIPGCASGEPDGFTFGQLRDAVQSVARAHEVVGFDLVEVNPVIDVGSGATSLLAAQLIVELLGEISVQRSSAS